MSSKLKKASVGPAFLGGILAFLLFGLFVLIWFRLSGKTESFDDQRAVARAAKLDQLQKDNHEKLTSYAWVSKDKGVVQLPIDRAMEVVVADLKAKPVKASSVKLEVPYPAGLQQPPAAAAVTTTGSGAPATAASPAPAPAANPAAAAPTNTNVTSGTANPGASPAPSASPAVAPASAPATAAPAPSVAAVPAATTPPAPSVTTTPAP
ncbi:MAG: hypothetical protein WCD79_16295 [Chthoniobacteraceae bacterium]